MEDIIEDNNLKLVLEEFEKWKGQFVIIDRMKFIAERLVAIGDDEWDWCYITFDGRDLHWNVCNSSIMPLKGYLRDEDYNVLIRSAKLNHSDQLYLKNNQENVFLDAVEKEISEYPKNRKIITDFCWELNDIL